MSLKLANLRPEDIVIGRRYRIIPNHGKRYSRIGKMYPGRIFICLSVENYAEGYVISNIPGCGGIWLCEIEPVDVITYETVG